MGLDVPELDDREYEEWLDEAKKLLPAYSEEWTNYNPQDPGIAILETLAHITDTYTYQLDAITDSHRAKYLQLIGDRQRPPTAASTRLELHPPDGAAGIQIPAGTQLTVVDGSGTEKIFETDEGIVLSDARIERIVTETESTRADHSRANETAGMFYRPLGGAPEPGNSMALGLSADPFAAAATLSLTVSFHDDDLPEPASHGNEASTFEPSVDLVWEYCTDYSAPEDAWEPFSVVRDDTNALYEGGTVTLAAPETWTPAEWGVSDHGLFGGPTGLVWIRCRVRSAGYEIPPRVDAVKLGVVAASNRMTVEHERLQRARRDGGAAGLTAQRYHFEHAPVLDAEITVDGESWTQVSDFDASGPTDRHYVLDQSAGVVRFGDGVQGQMPEPTQDVVAERYVAGGGEDGNVPASATWRFVDGATAADGDRSLSEVSVTPRRAATGGTDEESIADAFRRVKRDLQTPYRAVTRDDIEYVATHTPGLRVGRATTVLAARDTADVADAPPVVRVIVVPYAPTPVTKPTPSEGFLQAVRDHVDTHRLLTDRVRVEPPDYVDISVSVTVKTTQWRPGPDGKADVESALTEYVDPIHGYDGDGWPFGRTLYADEVVEVLTSIEWVDAVAELSITAPGNARVDRDENVRIDGATLFAIEEITTDIESTARRDGSRGD